jgi:hypothetical protein
LVIAVLAGSMLVVDAALVGGGSFAVVMYSWFFLTGGRRSTVGSSTVTVTAVDLLLKVKCKSSSRGGRSRKS